MLITILANRRERVKLNGMFFDFEIVNCGVPQGTVLGPLIFLLHVNDFSSNINTTEKVIQFADDTSTVRCGQESSSHGKIKEILQKKTVEYVEMNKLTLIQTKRKLFFSRKKILVLGSIFLQKGSSHKTNLQMSWNLN